MNISKTTIYLFAASALLLSAARNNFVGKNEAQPTGIGNAVIVVRPDGSISISEETWQKLYAACSNDPRIKEKHARECAAIGSAPQPRATGSAQKQLSF